MEVSERKLIKAGSVLRRAHHVQMQPYQPQQRFLFPLACRKARPAAPSAEVRTEVQIVSLGSNLRSPKTEQDVAGKSWAGVLFALGKGSGWLRVHRTERC